MRKFVTGKWSKRASREITNIVEKYLLMEFKDDKAAQKAVYTLAKEVAEIVYEDQQSNQSIIGKLTSPFSSYKVTTLTPVDKDYEQLKTEVEKVKKETK
jgi:uncharacterized membrane protein